jgi:hypothetical protein
MTGPLTTLRCTMRLGGPASERVVLDALAVLLAPDERN